MTDTVQFGPTVRSGRAQVIARMANESPHPSRPMAGTLDPAHIPGFVALLGEASTFEIAYRFGWSPREALRLCQELRGKGILSSRTEAYEGGIVCIWKVVAK